MKIDKVIEKYFIENFKLDIDKDYVVENIKAENLLVSERIDLIAKVKYLESINLNLNTDYFEKLYMATIEAFSNGDYTEPGKEQKNSFEKYKEEFKNIEKSILNYGFDSSKSVIPVGNNGAIIDGGHRVATAIYHDIDVPCIFVDNASVKYDLSFFKRRLLSDKYLDYLCYEYIKRKKNIYIICLWPVISKDDREKANNIINEELNVIYSKKIKLNYNGLKNFMIEIYGHQPWVGTPENGFIGVEDKVNNCYKDGNELTCIIVEDDPDKVLNLKAKIRDLIKIGNHSIHSTDNINESIDMASLILNENSIYYLNNGQPYKYPDLIKKIIKFKNTMKNNNVNFNDFVIDSGTVMAMFGLRENDDIDILINNKYTKLLNDIDTHNESIDIYNSSIDELIYNSKNYFYYFGMKFLTIQNVKNMKSKRLAEKDYNDIKMINKLDKNNSELKARINNISLSFKKIKRKVKKIIVDILRKLKLLDFIKKILKK